MRRRLAAVGALALLGPTACASAVGTAPAYSTSAPRAQFSSVEQAVKQTCHAVYVGLFIQGSHNTEVQWESKEQAGSGNGQVARLRRSSSGVVVTNCHFADYAHG